MSSKRTLDFPISNVGSEQSGAERSTTLESEGANKKPVSSGVDIKINYANRRDKKQKEREQLLSRLSPFGLGVGAVYGLLDTWRENRMFAEDALQFYNETKNTEFELVNPLHSDVVELFPPESNSIEKWCHVIFTAKEKNDGSGAIEKYFFAELKQQKPAWPFDVISCQTFELRDCVGVGHGCHICPPSLILHPGPGKFVSGGSSYSVVEWAWT